MVQYFNTHTHKKNNVFISESNVKPLTSVRPSWGSRVGRLLEERVRKREPSRWKVCAEGTKA